ncbi:hypothetical protein EWM64_g10690 [Hericium alpestre]|uniref:Uncharacterized protein n=1 Tax=Hericium alpestre TaxID=135208 RepID=A0A4Y9ZFF1_9AGAM|nr:hypothetical protein EWM64_g10690 [Hericium alpestre]
MSEDDSLSALECALQFFVCTNAMQAIMQMYLDNGSAPRTQELRGAWTREVGKRIHQYREERGIVKRSLRREQTSLHRFVHRIIKVNDAGTVKQYLVEDAVTSHNKSTTFHLKDLNNPEQLVRLTPDAFEVMTKGALSISEIVDVPVGNDT